MVASHVLRGYYVDPKAPPATPLSKDKVPATRKIDDMVISLANSYGWPIAYAQEQSGRLIHNLFPIKSSEAEQISSSSKVELQLHKRLISSTMCLDDSLRQSVRHAIIEPIDAIQWQ